MSDAMPGIKNFEQLLRSTRQIVKHHKEKEILKGESFNIFSILGMEHKENSTHSAFLCELLSPQGSHLKGSIFLQLFLGTIKNTTIDIATASVTREMYIGPRNDEAKTGGRIDIYIADNSGHCISIENKIYASDQYAQIERYCNHRTKKNSVYYLTLSGHDPSLQSKGTLLPNQDFHIISYKNHIIDWLQLCVKEAVDVPILRETIRQYILLIQKLTATMDNTMEQALLDLILRNYEEARYLSLNIDRARQQLGEEIRLQVIHQLKERLDKYEIIPGETAENKFSQVWIKPKSSIDSTLYFGIESFSGLGHFGGNLFIGVFNDTNKHSKFADLPSTESFSKWWMNVHLYANYERCHVNLSTPETIINLHTKPGFREGFVQHIITETMQYLETQLPIVAGFILSDK